MLARWLRPKVSVRRPKAVCWLLQKDLASRALLWLSWAVAFCLHGLLLQSINQEIKFVVYDCINIETNILVLHIKTFFWPRCLFFSFWSWKKLQHCCGPVKGMVGPGHHVFCWSVGLGCWLHLGSTMGATVSSYRKGSLISGTVEIQNYTPWERRVRRTQNRTNPNVVTNIPALWRVLWWNLRRMQRYIWWPKLVTNGVVSTDECWCHHAALSKFINLSKSVFSFVKWHDKSSKSQGHLAGPVKQLSI